jgi:histone chaperone ASF1
MPQQPPPDLEWKLIYVSSPEKEELDQELDDCLVGPVPIGINSFEFEGAPPDPRTIPEEDVLGVAALILTGSYKDQEFVRVGYYQNTEYDNDEMKEMVPPPKPILFDRLVRDISTKPRVTRFQIKWCVVIPLSFFFCCIDHAETLGMSPHLNLRRRPWVQPLRPLYPQPMTSTIRWTSTPSHSRNPTGYLYHDYIPS